MRLDVFLFESGFVGSRTEGRNAVVSGAVLVDGKVVKKPAFDVTGMEEKVILDRSVKKYVSRGGLKLDGALCAFGVSAEGKSALDIGASSGGFTDCLLKHGAAHVIAVDSGEGQLVQILRSDDRVTSMEKFNARYMEIADFPYRPDLAVMDVSFISSTLILPSLYSVLAEGSDFILLVKPQFEVGREHIGKGGIVKDEKARETALQNVIGCAVRLGFCHCNTMISPILGGDGNLEYLVHFRKEKP